MKDNQACSFGGIKIFIGRGFSQPKNPHKRYTCPDCKRRIKTGIVKCDDDKLGGNTSHLWYVIVPQHKKRKWWKIK